ncbi:Thioesterase [Methylobacterium sp. 4-46]|nr:Thioesterase [Methylobacterium sp. 4-46]
MEAAAEALLPLLDSVRHRPLALVGWSLGCKIAFALARRLEETGTVARLLMLGACPSPDRPVPASLLPRPGESWAEPLRRLGGTAEAVLAHDGMLGTLRDSLEGDFAMATGYRSEAVVAAPILAVAAEADALVSMEAVEAWEARTSAGFTLHRLPGGHFALRDEGPALARLLAGRLAGPPSGPAAEDPRAWFPLTPSPPRGRPQVVCFHHAGGNAGFFRPWLDVPALAGVAVCPVELPGRGGRFGEAPRADLAGVARALSDLLAAHLDWSRPVILFGHSLGALIAYETALRLEGSGLVPAHLVVSARRAPDVPTPQPWRHTLADDALLAELARIGGTDAAILAHWELMALMLPAIRADFTLTDPYHRPQPEALDCPILAIRGQDDAEIGEADMAGWEAVTRSGCARWHPAGGHFYLADPPVRSALAERLARLAAAAG